VILRACNECGAFHYLNVRLCPNVPAEALRNEVEAETTNGHDSALAETNLVFVEDEERV
jgi:hypothetical protein